ncbi:hypothetical protein OG758_15045 [Streptomyces sp. NBC_01474]|uniref:hypothetical protein n=1 Tax=unclassified Streptomyces TaxID=2593676 RepID=UPI002DD85843|nr:MULTISPECIES: hypothetical protein [unclassified Streptomyces]WSD95322.1 hypothetical protein OG758_15045 [Streptomyces sp. NBC_01474]
MDHREALCTGWTWPAPALAAMPDDVREETLALIDDIAADRAAGHGSTAATDAVLRGRVWVVYGALGGLLIVLDAGRIA